MKLAACAGIDVAPSRIVALDGIAVAVTRRFDRTPGHTSPPDQSAASMLLASRDEDRSDAEIADAIRSLCHDPFAILSSQGDAWCSTC